MKTISEKNGLHKQDIQIQDCGLANYREILDRQKQIFEEIRWRQSPDTILILEHQPVITLGARGSKNKLLLSRDELKEKGIDVVDIRRGGGTTAHNPGQLVFYPILRLQRLNLGINQYIRKLEGIGSELLAFLGIEAASREGFPGLWVGQRKIASIGVRVSRFITHHGMAINIQNDLSIFDYIVPCGIDDIEMTSVLRETGKKHKISIVKEKLSQILIKHFS